MLIILPIIIKVREEIKQKNTFNQEVWAEKHGLIQAPKASKRERGEGNSHPTVKSLAVMAWLVRLVSKEGDTVLDPFMGSGTTLVAAQQLGRRAIGIEKREDYFKIAERRIYNTAPLFVRE